MKICGVLLSQTGDMFNLTTSILDNLWPVQNTEEFRDYTTIIGESTQITRCYNSLAGINSDYQVYFIITPSYQVKFMITPSYQVQFMIKPSY